MTTKDSPIEVLRAQAVAIATHMKKAERGEVEDERIKEAREKGFFKVGIAMDDKLITIEISMETIRNTGARALSEYILKQMREEATQ